jgi:hemerythrin
MDSSRRTNMALIDWKEEFSVGVREFDNQHKKLVDIANKLHDAMRIGQSRNVMDDIFKELVEYTKEHFKNEEIYFDKYAYPDGEKHKIEHTSLVDKVSEYYNQHVSGNRFLSVEVMDFLKDWLLKHIAGSDKTYGKFFNSKGVF